MPLTVPMMNSWEVHALEHTFAENELVATANATGAVPKSSRIPTGQDTVHDALIYPGLYSATGFDILSILFQVISRPMPRINLGPVDASCAIVMCDLQLPDRPLVYVSDAFTHLTGYSKEEVLGQNCRFLQAPGGQVRKSSARQHIDKVLMKQLKRSVERNEEMAVEVVNFKKNGQMFVNLLAMIPVCWNSPTPRYSVGFLAEKTW